jgi:molybdopterin-dependent oxidoreductase alpha subunit
MSRNRLRPGVQVESPPERGAPSITAPPTAAGGVPAVVSTMRHSWRAMGTLRSLQVLSRVNQMEGFDCPGCAWPDPAEHRTFAEFCENGAKAIAEEATTRRAGPELFSRFSVAELSEQSDFWLGQQGRLTRPMLLREGATHYQPTTWEEAFRLIAEEINALASPDEAVFYTSGRTSNEAAFLFQLLVRRIGTNNLPDCSNMCHESSGYALGETIGIGKGTVTLEDFERAELILVIGQNPGTNHPRMLTALERAVHQGARIVSINPLPEVGLARFKQPQDLKNPLRAGELITGEGTRLAELHVPVRINGDVAFLQGVIRELLEEEGRRPGEVLAHDFITARTEGFEALRESAFETPWEELVEQSGISREMIRRVAEMVMHSERIIVTWAMGLTQHRNAVANIQEIVNLVLLRGSIGKPGAGLCPVRGHSNVQGDRTMGIVERPRPEFLDRLEEVFGFSPPREAGYDTVAAIQAMASGKVGVFFAMGGNFLSAAPDTHLTARALSACRLTVQVSTKLNRSHLVTGQTALILPCLARTDRDVQRSGPQFVSVENSMGVVHSSRGTLPPASADLLSEPVIVSRLAQATLGSADVVPWAWLVEDYDRIRDLIEQVVPGFERFNERVREPGGFELPNVVRAGGFGTSSGRARFSIHPLPRIRIAEGELLLMTIRSHDQFNTTIYGLDDRYRGVRGGRRVVFLSRTDIEERGLSEGDLVDLIGVDGDGERIARNFRVVPYEIPRGCAASYFPEANPVVAIDSVAYGSNTPASKSVVIRIEPSSAAAAADGALAARER